MQVTVRKDENIDRALKRFKSLVMQEGILETVYQKRTFENKARRKKRKQQALHKKLKYPTFWEF